MTFSSVVRIGESSAAARSAEAIVRAEAAYHAAVGAANEAARVEAANRVAARAEKEEEAVQAEARAAEQAPEPLQQISYLIFNMLGISMPSTWHPSQQARRLITCNFGDGTILP